jgi:hypothetical protein
VNLVRWNEMAMNDRTSSGHNLGYRREREREAQGVMEHLEQHQ